MTGYAKSICIELMASEIIDLRSMVSNEQRKTEELRQRVVELTDEIARLRMEKPCEK